MDTLFFAFNAILPIILLIFLGYFLKRRAFLEEEWFRQANKFTFKIALPLLLFVNVYSIESFSSINWSIVIYSELALMIAFFLGILLVKLTIPDKRQKGVILQCVFRSNFSIIGLPIAASLGGSKAESIAAVLSAFSIPTFNILAILALTMFQEQENGKKTSPKEIAVKIAKNPLILGVVCGLICLCIRSILPVHAQKTAVFTLKDNLPFLYTSINNVAKIASPLSLIILGGLFNFSAVKEMKKQIMIGTLTRVLIVPFFAIGGAALLQYPTEVFPALLALFGSPVAVSSAIMAQEMDNDGVLAGQLVVWTSIFSIFTLFFFILALKNLGLV